MSEQGNRLTEQVGDMSFLKSLSPIAVIGATRGVGALLLQRLLDGGAEVIGIGRDTTGMASFGETGAAAAVWHQLNAGDEGKLRQALFGARTVVHCAPPGLLPRVVRALPPTVSRLVVTGSARRFTRFPDQRAREVEAAERAALSAGIAATVLHPTMIYGASGEQNVSRIIDIVKRSPVLPLPRGGRSLVQPISCDDVVDCLLAALERPETTAGRAIVIAGPAALTYGEFVRTCARAVGRRAFILPVPAWLALMAARLSQVVPGLPSVEVAEMRRLLEDKDADITDMRQSLGVSPVPFTDGLKAMLEHEG